MGWRFRHSQEDLVIPFHFRGVQWGLDVLEFSQYMVQDIGCFMPGVINLLHGLQDRSLKEQGTNGNLTIYFRQLHSMSLTWLRKAVVGTCKT